MEILRFGHSSDVDDAYMFFGLATGLVRPNGFLVKHVIEEIEALNRRAQSGELEVTAVSAHGYALVSQRYVVMASGASVARGYGPRIVALEEIDLDDLEAARIAVPGRLTTAHLLAQVFFPPFEPVFLPFRDVEGALQSGFVRAAILIHEGQIHWEQRGYNLITDLGRMFRERIGLPLPLGLDVVRRDLGPDTARMMQRSLRDSIICAHEHHEAALDYALPYGRGIDRESADRFVRMYVNEDTLDLAPDAEEGLRQFYAMAVERRLIPAMPTLDIIR